jgi:hypothetical protein
MDMLCEIMYKKLSNSGNSAPSTHNYLRHIALPLNVFKRAMGYDDNTDRPVVGWVLDIFFFRFVGGFLSFFR